jgi:hypothetical protein
VPANVVLAPAATPVTTATGRSSTLPRVLTDVLSLGLEVEARDNRNSSANGRFRRYLVVAACFRERPFTEATAVARPPRRQLVFLPQTGPPFCRLIREALHGMLFPHQVVSPQRSDEPNQPIAPTHLNK